MLRAEQSVLPDNAELIELDVMQEHIDAAEVVSGQVDLLTVEASLDIILAQHFFHLQQQRTGAAGRVYKDVIFDTGPVAGKVYKNSENRRKQGVSCGFRCSCRYSISLTSSHPERGCSRCRSS